MMGKSNGGSVKRGPLDSDMKRELKFHLRLTTEYMDSLSVEKRKSDYPKAKADYLIFDPEGTAVIEGRHFDGGAVAFWRRAQQLPTSAT
jgi:hypothetical protein